MVLREAIAEQQKYMANVKVYFSPQQLHLLESTVTQTKLNIITSQKKIVCAIYVMLSCLSMYTITT